MRVCIYHTPCILSYTIYVHHVLQYVLPYSYIHLYTHTEEETLDMNGANRVSTLFSGTSIITVRGGMQQDQQVEEASYNSGTTLLGMCVCLCMVLALCLACVSCMHVYTMCILLGILYSIIILSTIYHPSYPIHLIYTPYPYTAVPQPPDHGALAYVLRTGFSSSQGHLLQMIEFSQQTVTGDSVEIGKR